MQVFTGRIRGLLHNSADEVSGFALDSGVDIHFPPNGANRVLAGATAGALVRIHVSMRGNPGIDVVMKAISTTDLDSRRSASLQAPTPPNGPEQSTGVTPSPNATTPLAPSLQTASEPSYSEGGAAQALATRNNVADEMGQAYDLLHRIQAILAYVKMMKQDEPTTGHYLDEAQHTYVQALSRYQARDFEGAREFAAASISLSRVVEILVLRVFHSETNYPKLAPPPPEHIPARSDASAAQHDLDRIERSLARIHWVTENGTLPSEDRTQVQKLSSWTKSLHGQARHLLKSGAIEDAVEFARAADATACSAEHLCRKCYVTRNADFQSSATAR
jgi:hypothetical protein